MSTSWILNGGTNANNLKVARGAFVEEGVGTSSSVYTSLPKTHRMSILIICKDLCGRDADIELRPQFSQIFHSECSEVLTDMRFLEGCTSPYNYGSRFPCLMAKRERTNAAQIVLFPSGESVPIMDLTQDGPAVWRGQQSTSATRPAGLDVVLSGSFRRDVDGLRLTHQELQDLGCRILSPRHVSPALEVDGFVYMSGEEAETPERIELKHLDAIQRANFVWLHAPDGYVGLSAALEVGYAHAQGIPVFCKTPVSDTTVASFLRLVNSVSSAIAVVRGHSAPIPRPNLTAFQHYYKRIASQRGYEKENAQNCLLLMVEEVGELARAIRKQEKLMRHGSHPQTSEAQELADVFLYVIHMANILGLDLGDAVRDKETLNLMKFAASQT